ncbi:MAG: NAD(P)/FAD-dependent oxidoreductase [Rhizobiales bacterium]|nr:NAD(P)/FAD-dependent oxidoreductase [Hyphomicrobiales bacterium]
MHGMAPSDSAKTGTLAPTITRPRVVILGAGFGGLNAAQALRSAPVDVTVIDRRNYHLFQPLLYQVATAGLSPAQIATPIRRILARQKNATVLMDRVLDVDLERRLVITRQREVPYDYLIVATGARHAYFGHDEWEAFAPGLKKIDDATALRTRILAAFERAEVTEDEAERKRLLTFVVIGAGPTGVEMAGAIAELAKMGIARDFRNIDPRQAEILLVEAGPRILASFPDSLSQAAQRQLERLGVKLVLGEAVVACDADGIALKDGRRIDSGTLVWAAGVEASPAAKWLKAPADRAGRVIVAPDLRLPGYPNVFVIGDTAAVKDAAGIAVPGIAPAAKQMGRFAANEIIASIKGKPPRDFTYRDYGNLATIGRKAAVADFGRFRFSGLIAWLLWSFAHVWFLIGFRNRFTVFFDWIWAYVTYQRGARLITGGEN